MRTDKPITISQIKARESAMSARSKTDEVSDNYYLYDIVERSIKLESSTLRTDAFKFFQGCSNYKNANLYAEKCLSIMESVDEQLLSVLEGMMCKEIIPYIDDLDGFKNYAISRHSLSEATVNKLYDAIKVNKICDRILNNDARMSGRFNFDKYIRENAYKSYETNVTKICSMIDTYSTPSYAKLNIALEEISYIFQKNAINYDRARMVQLVTEYFINANNGMPADKVKDFKNVLTENCCITDDDLSKIKYFMEDFEISDTVDVVDNSNPYSMNRPVSVNINNTNNCIVEFNKFKASTNKSVDTFTTTLRAMLENTQENRMEVIPIVFDWMRNFAVIELEESDKYCDLFFEFVKDLVDHAYPLLVSKIMDLIVLECDKVSTVPEDDERFYYYSNTISKMLDCTKEKYDTVAEMATHTSSIAAMKDISEETLMLDEFKVFKFQNLIRYAVELDKALAKKESKLLNKVKNKAKQVFNSAKEWLKEDYDISNTKNENIIDCITEDFHFDHIVAIFEVTSDLVNVQKAFEEFCNEMTHKFSDPHVFAYCESVDNIIEIHITDRSFISLTEEQNEEWTKVITEAEQAYIGYLMNLVESFDRWSEINVSDMATDFAKVESTLTSEGVLGVIEASKYLNGMISLGRLQEIADNYYCNNPVDYKGNTAISQALDNWKLEESSLDMVVETVSMLREAIDESLLTEAEKDDKKDKEEKVEKTKINFNTLKYAMITLDQKAKKAGDKATQFSQTLNIYVEKFITSVKKLYTNNDREQIIKGSVIPSFHQLMGRLLVTGGISTTAGVVAGSQAAKAAGIGLFGFSATAAVFAAVVTIFATIAISKRSTDKERALMLDEIEIELDICNKELQRAEAAGQMKKYKALMYRQAKLKREFQRIKYNIGVKDYKRVSAVKDNND